MQNAYFTPEGERDLAIEQEYFREGSERVKELFDTYDNIILSDEGIWQTAFVRTRGKDTIEVGDTVIIVTTNTGLNDLKDILA